MNSREKFIVLIDNQPLEKADAIILLEGDGLSRVGEVVRLYKEGFAPVVVFSGGIDDPDYGSFTFNQIKPKLIEGGISDEDIILEGKSQNTRDEAVEVMKLVKKNGWKKIILVASHYHQYRAFLTFLKVRNEMGLAVKIINSPAKQMPWFSDNPWGKRINILETEFDKIEKYSKLGHMATFEEAIEYYLWAERI